MVLTTRITFNDFWEKYAREACGENVSSGRAHQYDRQMDVFIRPEFGAMEIRKISTEDIDRFLTGLSAECARGIRSSIKALLYRVFYLAVIKGVRPDNPVENAVKIRRICGEAFRYSEQACIDILRAFTCSDLSGAFILQFLTGLSRSEIYALRAGGIDINSCRITIDQFYVFDEDRRPAIMRNSNNYRSRCITIADCAMDVLTRELINREKRKKRAGNRWKNEHDLIFTESDGRPVNESHFNCELRRVREKCGFIGSRSLQENFGVLAVDLGASTVDLNEYLGHKSFEPVARYIKSKGKIRDDEAINDFYENIRRESDQLWREEQKNDQKN